MQLNSKKLARDPRFDSKTQQKMVGQQESGDVYTQNTHTHTHTCVTQITEEFIFLMQSSIKGDLLKGIYQADM